MPLTGCASDLTRRISDRVPGATCFVHPNGCDLVGADFQLMGKILEHHCTHPNVGGVLFLTMGCASALALKLPAKVKETGRFAETINTQQVGGTTRTVEKGTEIAGQMVELLSRAKREATDLSAVVVGTSCGASDKNSFAICHPVVGRACDMLVEQGATVVLSEDCELMGSARLLGQRAVNDEIRFRINNMAAQLNQNWKARYGLSFDEQMERAGLDRETLTRQSMDHVAKAGTKPITGFFEMEDRVNGPGLVILNAPNTDLENVTCLAAAGCNIILFTTGRGTCVGSPTSITLKITATAKTAEIMEENIDLSVASVTEGSEDIDSAAERVVAAVIQAANGQQTKAEMARHYEVAIPIRGVTY
jgi:altronate dehydratase large subunit